VPPDVTVSLLTFNSAPTLPECLSSLRAQRGVSLDIVLVDNASRDRTVALLRETRPDLPLFRHRANLYFARGHNRILMRLRGRHLLLLNPDVRFDDPRTVRRLVDSLDADPTLGAIVPPHTGPDGREEHVGRRAHTLDTLLARFSLAGTLRPMTAAAAVRAQDLHAPPEGIREIESAQASCLLVRADLFRRLGGFDPRFRLYFTDDELCLRIRKAGFRIGLAAGPRILHHRSHSLLRLGMDQRHRIIHADLRLFAKLYLRPADAAAVWAASAFTWGLWRAAALARK
jgi:hypothetical protein